jgi:protein TonB
MKPNYQNMSMNDIVFENRNKAYGAYALRMDYDKSLFKAVSITVLTALLFVGGNFIVSKLSAKQILSHHDVVARPTDLPSILLQQKVEPPKPIVEQAETPKAKGSIKNPEMAVVAETQAHEDSVVENDQLKNFDSGLTTNTDALANNMGVTDGTGTGDVVDQFTVAKAVEPTVFNYAEVMPEFPGGVDKLMQFLQRNTEYPDRERELGISGKVTTSFTVNEDGTISDIAVLKSPSPGFNKEVVRVIKRLPRFTPGMQQGRKVKVRFVLPFTFNTND